MGVSLSALSALSAFSLASLSLCLFRPLPAPLLSGVGLGVGQTDKAPTYILKGYTMLMTNTEVMNTLALAYIANDLCGEKDIFWTADGEPIVYVQNNHSEYYHFEGGFYDCEDSY